MKHLGLLPPISLPLVLACSPFDAGDSPVGDGGSGEDVALADAAEAGTKADAGGRCPPNASCLFFDDGSTFGDDWKPHESGGAPAPIITNGQMLVRTNDNPATDDISSRLHRTISTTVKHVRLGFDVSLSDDIQGSTQQVTLAEITCANQYVLVNVTKNNQVGLSPLDDPPFDPGTTSLPAKAHIVLDASWTDGNLHLLVNDTPADDTALPACGAASSFELRLGLGTATSEPASATYDNVILELDPP